jgi:ribosomal protein S12 methylthiotransferase
MPAAAPGNSGYSAKGDAAERQPRRCGDNDSKGVLAADRVGCFQYSPVEGAKANGLPEPVPDDIKQQRYDRFMQTQADISAARLQQKVGRTIQVLIDEIDDEGAVGRSSADAPEIDGQVFLDGESGLQVGQLLEARVVEAGDYDLWAERI